MFRVSRTARVVYLVLVTASCLGFLLTLALWALSVVHADELGPDPSLLSGAAVALVATAVLFLAHTGVALYWVYRAWAWLPPEHRYAELWRGVITPGEAALLLLVPYFHYYWMFVVSLGLCDALDRITHGTRAAREPGLRPIAIAACIGQLLMPLPAGAIMWGVFMTKIERLANATRPIPVPAT